MKKIIFNDRYGLTQAVIEGRKTMTRRIVRNQEEYYELRWFQPYGTREKALYGYDDLRGGIWEVIWPAYVMHEVVAVAQSYRDIGAECFEAGASILRAPELHRMAGWANKMFVKSELMPYQIRITGIKCERLQDISDADCLKEGIFVNEYFGNGKKCYHYGFDGFFNGTEGWFARGWFDTPREAFAALINKVSGCRTWDRNPYVMVYEFELVK